MDIVRTETWQLVDPRLGVAGFHVVPVQLDPEDPDEIHPLIDRHFVEMPYEEFSDLMRLAGYYRVED